MSNASQTPENRPAESTHPAPPRQGGFYEKVEALMARLPAVYVLLGAGLLVASVQDQHNIGPAAPGLAVAGGLCFVASAIAHRRG